MPDDEDLLELAQQDPDAFAVFADRHARGLYRYLYSRLWSPEDVEDLHQDALLTAFDKRATYDRTQGSAAAWLYGIAKAVMLNHLRKRERRSKHLVEVPDGRLPEETRLRLRPVEDLIVARGELSQIQTLLNELEQEERDVIVLSFWCDLPPADVAKLLGISVSKVNYTKHRVVTYLRSEFGEAQRHE